jgi:hypothetical protein
VTAFPVPTLAVANAAVPVQLTTSPPITPLSVHPASVALAVPSYPLFAAVTVGATDFWVTISALVPIEAP